MDAIEHRGTPMYEVALAACAESKIMQHLKRTIKAGDPIAMVETKIVEALKEFYPAKKDKRKRVYKPKSESVKIGFLK